MSLDRRTLLDRAVREFMREAADIEIVSDMAISAMPQRDSYEIRIQLRRRYGVIEVTHNELTNGPSAVIDSLNSRIIAAAAQMRGDMMREWLEFGRAVEFVPNPENGENERDIAERMGAFLSQFGERLLKKTAEMEHT
jgi:hypothetical protein